MITAECVDSNSYCPGTTDCVARELWAEVHKAIMTVLRSITLQNLALKKQNTGAEFIAASEKAICPNMKKITLEKVT